MGFFSSDSKVPSGPPPSYPDKDSNPPPEKPPPAQPQYSSGAGPSFQPPRFAALVLARRDRVRIVNFPENIAPALGESIARVWVTGIQQQGPYDANSYEWKLSGNPWSGWGHEDVPARRLMVHILHTLAANGYHLVACTDMSKRGPDKDTLIFRPGPAAQRWFFAVSFNEFDKIRLIDSPNDEVTRAFAAAVRTWPLGIQDEKEKEPGCYQLKLRGRPWLTGDGAQVNAARILACSIMASMEMQGYDLAGSVDMSIGRGEDHGDLDTWFFASRI
ncbi:hypothetical protein EHS25_005935 [Saitozyma podzolica]|uniref:Uncharacterized protein n=1 Tax=Saitozyma podzolica TaxID=1890683 RepID=A0A427XTV5_9TREE|nr:hypothetical protein EHS25_005935 [Saitozyma podzolica]